LSEHEEKPPAGSDRMAIDAIVTRLTEALQAQGYTIRPVDPDACLITPSNEGA